MVTNIQIRLDCAECNKALKELEAFTIFEGKAIHSKCLHKAIADRVASNIEKQIKNTSSTTGVKVC